MGGFNRPKNDPSWTYRRTVGSDAERMQAVHQWVAQDPNRYTYCDVLMTGSMRPAMEGGDYALLEKYTGQELKRGNIVYFDRGDAPAVSHRVLDVDDDAVYLDGDANSWKNAPIGRNTGADGWFKKSKIKYIVRDVVGVKKP